MKSPKAALLLSPLLAGCIVSWGNQASPPGTPPESTDSDAPKAKAQIGRAVETMTYAPATLTSSRQLGVPFNRRLQITGTEKLYDAEVQRIDVGGFDARWSYMDLRETQSGRLNVGLAGVAGISGSIGLERGQSHAVYSFEEIDHCEVIDEAVQFQPPARGRYFPVEICYGRRFSRVFSSSDSKLTAEAQVELMSIPIGAGVKKTKTTGLVSVREWGEGLRRKEDCREVNFAKLGTVGDCFEPGPAQPIRVRWREIKRKRKRGPKAAARAQHPRAGA